MKWFRIALSLLVVVGGAVALLLYSGVLSASVKLSEARGSVHDMDGVKAIAISLSITNESGPDRIRFATSPEAKLAMFHGVTDPMGAPIPASGAASLSLDGAHIMLMGISGELAEGRLIPLTITFENAGEVSTKAKLSVSTGGMDMSGADLRHGMDHSKGMMMEAALAPAITIIAAPVASGWRIHAQTERFNFAPAAMNGAHVAGEGHGHLYIGGLKIMRMTEPEAMIGALPPGRHEVRVTLNTNSHMAYHTNAGPVTATTFIDIPE